MYAVSTDQAIHAASRMRQEHGWEPVYWLVYPRARKQIENSFDGVLLLDHDQAIKGIPHFASCALSAIDIEFVRSHATEIIQAASMLERNDSTGQDMDLKSRLEFVYGLIACWNRVLTSVRADVVVFEEAPHH